MNLTADMVTVALPPFGMVAHWPKDLALEDGTHSPDKCKGHHCPFHNPSNHHMVDWPVTLRLDNLVTIRLDNFALVERVCPHGVGHPDPDSLAWLESVGAEGFGVHGCDGCCRERDELPKGVADSDH